MTQALFESHEIYRYVQCLAWGLSSPRPVGTLHHGSVDDCSRRVSRALLSLFEIFDCLICIMKRTLQYDYSLQLSQLWVVSIAAVLLKRRPLQLILSFCYRMSCGHLIAHAQLTTDAAVRRALFSRSAHPEKLSTRYNYSIRVYSYVALAYFRATLVLITCNDSTVYRNLPIVWCCNRLALYYFFINEQNL